MRVHVPMAVRVCVTTLTKKDFFTHMCQAFNRSVQEGEGNK